MNIWSKDHEQGLGLRTDTKGLHLKKCEHTKHDCKKEKIWVQMVIHGKQHWVMTIVLLLLWQGTLQSHLSSHAAFNPVLVSSAIARKAPTKCVKVSLECFGYVFRLCFWCVHVKSFLTLAKKELVFFSISVWDPSFIFFSYKQIYFYSLYLP